MGKQNFGIVKQCFLGAQPVSHWGEGPHCGLAQGDCGLGPCAEAKIPAMLTLHAPSATARLRLNVKGLNMGDNSPWQTYRSRAANRIGRLAPPHHGSVQGIPLSAGIPEYPGPCGPPLQKTPP